MVVSTGLAAQARELRRGLFSPLEKNRQLSQAPQCVHPVSLSSISAQLFANESVPDHVGFARVKINLINENDNRPVFSKALYNVSLFENTTVGTTVLQVHVSRSILLLFAVSSASMWLCGGLHQEMGWGAW